MIVARIYNEEGKCLGKIPHEVNFFNTKEKAIAALLTYCEDFLTTGCKVEIDGVWYNGN